MKKPPNQQSANLLERVHAEGTPLIDGERVTFAWKGRRAPQLRGDFSDWLQGEPLTLTRLTKDVWIHQITLPVDAYMEYMYYKGDERVADPFNPHTTPNGYGELNHFFYMPAAEPTLLAKRRRKVPKGSVTRHPVSPLFPLSGRSRVVYLYQPAADQPVPLLIVLDGRDYLRRARLPVIIDNLIAQERIQPIALALIVGGGSQRFVEYACSEAGILYLLEQILPLAHQHLHLADINASPGAHGILGASMGGLMALYTAVRMPRIFGKVLTQSASFRLGEYDSVVFDLIEHGNRKPLRIWMDAGVYDIGSVLAANRSMYNLLSSKGYSIEYREYPAGHNFPAWRDDIWHGLEYMYGK